MKKYWRVIKNSYLQILTYRLSFIFWRTRIVIGILIGYFLWLTIFDQNKLLLGYTESYMLTYMIIISLTVGIVMSTSSYQVAYDISYGRMNISLLKPINFFRFTFSKDIANKIINSIFSVIEIIFLIWLLHAPFILQTNLVLDILFILSLILASILYFEINLLLSSIAFWSFDTWSLRFMFSILISFLAGMFFPLDILPAILYRILSFLPFSYLIFFPIKIYLGHVTAGYLVYGFIILIIWIIILGILMKKIWDRGLKIYTAQGI